MQKIAFIIFLAVVIPVALLFIYFLVNMRLKIMRDDITPFECGFDPKRTARIPFSLRFFLLAVIFLIFDVEVSLLFPISYTISSIGKNFVLVALFFILFFILFGLFLEWKEGALD